MGRTVRVGALSTGAARGQTFDARFGGIEHRRQSIARGAELVILPELFAVPYVASDEPTRWRHLAEPLDGPTAQWAGALAGRLGVDILFGMALEGGRAKPVNAALLARRDGTVSVAAEKIRLPPRYGQERFGEEDHFSAGTPEIGTIDIGGIKVAVLICYDRRFADSWRQAAHAGADLVAVLVGGPAPDDPDGYFITELQTHARASGVYALAACRNGVETVLGFPVRHDGETIAIGPDGAVLARQDSGGAAFIDVDPERRLKTLQTSTSGQ
jgi:N-carbamoylputrescine amidase